MEYRVLVRYWLGVLVLMLGVWAGQAIGSPTAGKVLSALETSRGVCALLGDSKGYLALDLVRRSELIVYVQLSDRKDVVELRKRVDTAGVYGTRVYVERGGPDRIHLADNLADAVVVAGTSYPRNEMLRVLRPGGKLFADGPTVAKPLPKGTDEWSHPYHGPDNNPQSTDQLARGPYITQFMAEPYFGCVPAQTVAAGGRVFMAFGNMAFRKYHNAMLNTLVAANGYNGTILWKRKLKEGFMIHRNTMVATSDILYLGDDTSCKLLDAATGKLKGEIKPAAGIAGGTVWKWMALENGILYALMGGEEIKVKTAHSSHKGVGRHGHTWPWQMFRGYDYTDLEKAFGHGHSFIAIDPKTGKVLWHHREKEMIDSRGTCMKSGRIYFYSSGRFLACLDAKKGKVLWKRSDPELLESIGPHGKAQSFRTGFSTSSYVKCNDRYIFFAGTQRSNLLAISTRHGKIAWKKSLSGDRRYPGGNFYLILRPDAIYAAGRQGRQGSYKLDYATGKILSRFRTRWGCTRATGSIDSIFYRGRGTVRYIPESNTVEHITSMRPPCQDGVIISDGLLHWGLWVCGCNLSLFGHIGLGPAGKLNLRPGANASRLERGPAYSTAVNTSAGRELNFTGGGDGVVRAVDTRKRLQWKAYTGGEVRFPPVLWNGRVFAGSNDGWVYAFEAASGRLIWRFRAAPHNRWIPVFGKLISTWPVAGGVAVQDGVVYAAAGIVHYDGTHVYALDAVNGKIKWYNDTSGILNPELKNGISLQGKLSVKEGKLCFPGGNIYASATYDLATGTCLTASKGFMSTARPLFYFRKPDK